MFNVDDIERERREEKRREEKRREERERERERQKGREGGGGSVYIFGATIYFKTR